MVLFSNGNLSNSKIFDVGHEKKIKFSKSCLNPLCNLEHFPLYKAKFTNYLYILSFILSK